MSQNLSTLIESLRTATARDSVTPEQLAALFDAMRKEYEQLLADAASGGNINLQSINDAINALESALNTHKQEADSRLSSLNSYATQTDDALSQRIQALENMLSETPGVVNAPAILPFKQIIRGTFTTSPVVQGSTSAPWVPVYFVQENIFVARLASYQQRPTLAAGEKLYTSNTAGYNSLDKARTDILFSMGNDIYMHNGEALVQLTSNTVTVE